MALISADTGHHVLLTLETSPVVELAAVVVGQYFVSFFNLDTVIQFRKSHAIFSQIAKSHAIDSDFYFRKSHATSTQITCD